MTCKGNKLKALAILMLITALFVSNAPSLFAGGNKLDGRIQKVTSQKITLESGEELKVSPHVTMTNRYGKKIRFRKSIVHSWERLRVIMHQIEGEMMIVEIKELK